MPGLVASGTLCINTNTVANADKFRVFGPGQLVGSRRHAEGPATNLLDQDPPWFLYVLVQVATKVPLHNACYRCSLPKAINKNYNFAPRDLSDTKICLLVEPDTVLTGQT